MIQTVTLPTFARDKEEPSEVISGDKSQLNLQRHFEDNNSLKKSRFRNINNAQLTLLAFSGIKVSTKVLMRSQCRILMAVIYPIVLLHNELCRAEF